MRLAGERGESLLEVVATVTILGIAGVSLLVGLGTASRLSGTDRQHAEALVVLSRAAEAIKAHRPPGVTCEGATVDTYAPVLATLGELPAGWTAGHVRIAGVACVPHGPTTAPRVTIEAAAPGARPESIDVVPRLS